MFLDQTRWPPTTPIFSPYSETFAQVRQQYRDFYHRDKTGERDIVDLDEQFPIRFVFVFDTELGKELLTWMTSFLSHLSLYLYLSYTLSTWMTSFLSTFNAFPLLVCLRNCFANYLLHSNERFLFSASLTFLTFQPSAGRCFCWDAWAALSWDGERSWG